jgi:transcriptional regulator GlxA family with amidase domain
LSTLGYVHALRLEQAKQILETQDLPAEAVALEAGYQDPAFFGRLFQRCIGITPGQYRRKFGNWRTVVKKSQYSSGDRKFSSTP